MRFIVDECCPRSLVAALTDAGHDASYVRDVLGGASDADIAAAASEQGRIIVTQDYDFGDLAVRSIATPTGVILIQAADLLPVDQPAAVVDLVETWVKSWSADWSSSAEASGASASCSAFDPWQAATSLRRRQP